MYGSINDLGADRLAVRFWCEPTQTWVRIDCIWARNDRGYEPIVYLWIEIAVGSRPCSEDFALGPPVFLPPQKPTT